MSFGLATRTAGVTEGVMVSEPPVPLPEQPSLEQLRNQAKDLRDTSGVPLWEAQLTVARRYGFASWARLKRHVELVTRYSRFPERVATDTDADTFLRLGCLSYYDDEPGRWEQARRILTARRGSPRATCTWRPRRPTPARCAGRWPQPPRPPRGKAARSAGSRCATSPTPGTTRGSRGRRRSSRLCCCSRRAPT